MKGLLSRIAEGALARARRPPWIVLGALLLVWLWLYFSVKPLNKVDPPDNGEYYRLLVRLDGHYIYLNTMSLVADGDLDLQNQYARFGDPLNLAKIPTETGRGYIYPVGTSILNLPMYVVARGLAAVGNAFGADIPTHGYTAFHQRVTHLTELFAAFFALLLAYRLARRHVSPPAALWGTALVGLGTGIHFYAIYGVGYAHAWSAFAVALLYEYWDRTRGRHDLKRWCWLGACVGLCALVRMQEVLFALIPAVEGGAEIVRRLRARRHADAGRLAAAGAAATGVALVVASPQLIATHLHFGSVFAVPQGEHYMRWSAPFLWEVLYSSKHGLFAWTPLAYVAVLGLLLAPWRVAPARRLGAALLFGFVSQWWVNGSTYDWWGHWGFGLRRLVDCTVIFALGLAFVVERLRTLHHRFPRLAPHAAVALVFAPLIVLNLELSGAVSYGKQKIPDRPMTMTNVYKYSVGRMLDSVHTKTGNPTYWPYNWLWAWKHGVEVKRFDGLVGGELLYVHYSKYGQPGTVHSDVIQMDRGGHAQYTAGAWEAPETPAPKGPSHAWASSGARLLLPLFAYEHITLTLEAWGERDGVPLTIDVNGDFAKTIELRESAAPFVIPVPDGVLHAGTNELTFRCPEEHARRCVAVRRLRLTYSVPGSPP